MGRRRVTHAPRSVSAHFRIVKIWTGNNMTRAQGLSRRQWMPLPPTAYALLPVQTICDMCLREQIL